MFLVKTLKIQYKTPEAKKFQKSLKIFFENPKMV